MNMYILEDFTDFSPDSQMLLGERGHGGLHGGSTGTGTGERALAAQTRVGGLDRLRPLLTHIPDALRAGGWDNKSPIKATVERDMNDDGVSGRDFDLRDALAVATIWVAAETPNAEAADAALHSDLPDGTVTFYSVHRRLLVEIRYISDGTAAGGVGELTNALQGAGVGVEG